MVGAGMPILPLGKVKIMPLELEQATYARELPNLLDRAGKFVVIGGDVVAGVYDTYGDALKFGYDRFELRPFLVKQIEMVEQVHFFTRDLVPPCHT
jgi:predicted nucleotidyltransferase